jgi:hypothetical protein
VGRDLEPKDPEGLVFQAEWVSVSEAIDRLDVVAWLSLTASYLRDEVATGSLRLERWHPDGRVEIVASVAPSSGNLNPSDNL